MPSPSASSESVPAPGDKSPPAEAAAGAAPSPTTATGAPSTAANPEPDRAAAGPSKRPDGSVDAPILAAAASFYELLQVPSTATPQQLRQSFRRLSKRYHPDTTTLPVPVAERAFQRLKRAYSVLSDPQSRRLYDEQRSRRPSPAAPRVAAPTPPPGPGRGAPVSLRRALSGGEWFALLLLALALLLSLVLGIGVAWARGAELVRWPSWWTDLHPAVQAAGGGSLEDGKVETPQSPPLTAHAPDVPAP
jgi:hypothetical protein